MSKGIYSTAYTAYIGLVALVGAHSDGPGGGGPLQALSR